jgi:predicted MFS family arabinose efflux permease
VNVRIGITALVLIRLLLPNNVAPAREPFDSIGFLLGGLGLALVTVVLEIVDNGYLPLWSLALLLLTGVVLVLAALSHSKNRSTPLFDLSLFKIGTFRTGILMTVVGLLSCAGITFLVAVLLQDLFHYSAVHAGVVLFCSAVGAILTKPLIAPILGRVGYRWTLGGFPIVICASLLLLMTINDQTPDWYMCLALFVFGCGYSVFMNIVNSLPFLDVPPDKTSKATSLQGTILQLSSSLGVTCAALLLHRFLGDKQVRLGAGDSTTATLASFHLTFLVLGLVSLSLVTFSWLISGASKGLAIDQEGAQRLGVCE